MYTFNMKDASNNSLFQMSTVEVNIDTYENGSDLNYNFSVVGGLDDINNGFSTISNLTETVSIEVDGNLIVTGIYESVRFRIESDTNGRLNIIVKKI